jgi:hypothetical protein
MPALKGPARKKQLEQLRKKHPAVAAQLDGKILPFKRESPLVDSAFTTRHSEVHIRTGPRDNEVYAEVDLTINDGPSGVLVYWKMMRWAGGQEIVDHPYPHTDIEFGVDEIEAWATALYQAVQLAKKQGYLP